MRFLSVTVSMLIAMSSLVSAENMVVRQKTGDTSIAISNISQITFPAAGGVLISLNDGTSQSYAHENLYSLRFNMAVTAIEQIDAKENNAIVFDGTTVSAPTAGISVYSLDGSLVANGGSSRLDVSHLVSGVYIVKAGCLTAKIVK